MSAFNSFSLLFIFFFGQSDLHLAPYPPQLFLSLCGLSVVLYLSAFCFIPIFWDSLYYYWIAERFLAGGLNYSPVSTMVMKRKNHVKILNDIPPSRSLSGQ